MESLKLSLVVHFRPFQPRVVLLKTWAFCVLLSCSKWRLKVGTRRERHNTNKPQWLRDGQCSGLKVAMMNTFRKFKNKISRTGNYKHKSKKKFSDIKNKHHKLSTYTDRQAQWKMYKRSLHLLHKRRCPNQDIKYEKILNLINHQGNKIKIARGHHSRLTGRG